jgi:hypothetical protein
VIVVDLGCAPHEGEQSVPSLLKRYRPKILYGFDPDIDPALRAIGWLSSAQAAWTYDGHTELGCGGPNSLYDTIVGDYTAHDVWSRTRTVRCFDFAQWLLDHPEPTVVKMNIEGAEYTLLEHILDRHADRHVVEWLIAWHDEQMPDSYAERKENILGRLKAPVRPWTIDDITLCA